MKKSVKVFGKTVPLWFIVVIMMTSLATVFAAYIAWTQTFVTQVSEPMEVTVLGSVDQTVEPGLGYTGVRLLIHNKGNAPQKVSITWDCYGVGELVFDQTPWVGYCASNGNTAGYNLIAYNYTKGTVFTIYTDGYAPSGKSSYVQVQFQAIVPGEAKIVINVSRN